MTATNRSDTIGRTTDTDTRWSRALEALVLALPPVLGAGIVGILQQSPVPIVARTLVVGAAAAYVVISVGVPLCLYADARQIRRQSGRERSTVSWRPRPLVYAVAGVLWTSAASVVYLYQRHRYVGTRSSDPRWWIVVAVAPLVALVSIGIAVVGSVLGVPALVPAALATAGVAAAGAFPVAIYRDSAAVRTRSNRWRPNPGLYLGIALFSLGFPVLQLPLATYYLGRRHGALDPS